MVARRPSGSRKFRPAADSRKDPPMNGAESLVHTLLRSGVDTCFSNPGTSEMHFVAALDRVPGMRCVLGLFEGVVTGAADGYARMAGKPAATLLHCGPGLANGLANLHNARRAADADRQHRRRPGDLSPAANDAPLTADTEGWARGASGLGAHRDVVGHRGRRCRGRGAGRAHPSGPDRHADPAVRHLVGRGRRGRRGAAGAAEAASPTQPRSTQRRRASCAAAAPTLIVAGRRGGARRGAGARASHRRRDRRAADRAGRQRADGARPGPRAGRSHALRRGVGGEGAGRHAPRDPVRARKPVTFFAYPNKPTTPIPADADIHVLARPDQDAAEALARLADELGAPHAAIPDPGPRPEPARGALTPESVAATRRRAAAGAGGGRPTKRSPSAAASSRSPMPPRRMTG